MLHALLGATYNGVPDAGVPSLATCSVPTTTRLHGEVPNVCWVCTAAGYLGSMAGTLYAALVMHSYIMSLVCCAAQVCPPTSLPQPRARPCSGLGVPADAA